MSDYCKVLRVLSDVPADIRNTYCEFVTEVDCTQTRATFGGAVSIELAISLHADVENKYSGTVLILKV